MALSKTQKILTIVGASVLLLILICAGGAYALYAVIRQSTAASEKAVDTFHANYNKHDYQAIYNTFSPDMKQATPLDKLTKMLDYCQAHIGAHRSSSGTGWNVNSNNGVTYIHLGYSAIFAQDQGIEEFTFVEVNGSPQMVRFNIRTPKLSGYDPNAE